MTQKEIDRERKKLPGLSRTPWNEWPEDFKKLYNELSCREMINSCLCYGSIADFWKEDEWRWGDKSYAAPHVRNLGRERVEQLVAEQESDFAKATVHYGVFEDSEGLTYNSISWADDSN